MTTRERQRILSALRAFERRILAEIQALTEKIDSLEQRADEPIPYTVTEEARQ